MHMPCMHVQCCRVHAYVSLHAYAQALSSEGEARLTKAGADAKTNAAATAKAREALQQACMCVYTCRRRVAPAGMCLHTGRGASG